MGQRYVWAVNGAAVANGDLPASAAARSTAQDGVTVEHGDEVSFAVKSYNQWGESEPIQATGTAPTPTPEAPSGLTLSFTEAPT